MLDRLHWCAKQRNRTSMLDSWASCYIHISPFSIIYTKPLVMSYWYLYWIVWCINQVTVNAVYHDVKWDHFFYLWSKHIPSKWKNTRSNMQILTKIKNPTIINGLGLFKDLKTDRVYNVWCNFKLGYSVGLPQLFGTLKDSSLEIDLASNNCFLKFEQNRTVRTIQNFKLFHKNG